MVVAPLAIDLLAILACLGALIIILAAKQIVAGLFGVAKSTLGWIPWLGRRVTGSLDSIEQRLVSALSDTANGLQGVIGAFWHALGNLLSSIGNELVGLAKAIDDLGSYMHGVVRPWVVHTVLGGLQRGVQWLKHELRATKTQVFRVTKVIEQPIHTKIGGAVRTITKPLTASLAHLERWTRAQVAGLEHAIEDFIPQTIADLRSRAGTLERAYARLWRQVRGLDKLTAISVVTAGVAVAIARLDLGWLRCSNVGKLGRGLCRAPTHLIDDLLGLVADFAVLANICQVLPWLETGASEVAGPLIGALSKAGAGLCHGSSGPAPALAVPSLYLPTVSGTPTLQLP